MPSKASQHIVFFTVLLISAGLHWYVYANLKRVLLRDYPKLGKRLARIALWMFVILDTPFLFIYFRGVIHAEMSVLSRVLLYPFLVWQTIMLMWVLILLPITLWRYGMKLWKKLRNALPIAPDHENHENHKKNGMGVVTE